MAADEARLTISVEVLRKSPMDALVVASPSSVLLLTGYWPIMGTSLAILGRKGESLLLVPEDEVELARQTSQAKLHTYKPETLGSLESPIRAMAAALRPCLDAISGSTSAVDQTLGVELDQAMQPASYLTSTVFRDSLKHVLGELRPAAKLQPADALLTTLGARKTDTELAKVRRAAQVAQDGFARAAACIQPGLREAEVASRVQAAFDTSPRAEGLERSYGFFFCMSGPNSAKASAAFARTRQRVIAEGDLVMIHANTCADGYWTDITRTYTAGEPSERHRAMRAAIQEARLAALSKVRPGAKACDVDQAARQVMISHGFGEAFRHATGHGVGFAAASANALPRIHPKSADVLEQGMTFNIEPAAYFDGYGGMRHCDVVAVTADGAEVLTDF